MTFLSGEAVTISDPLLSGRLRLRNRTMMTAHSTGLPEWDYVPYVEARMREDVASVVLPFAAALRGSDELFGTGLPSEQASADNASAIVERWVRQRFEEHVRRPLERLLETASMTGTAVFVQLNHAGALTRHDQGSTHGGWPGFDPRLGVRCRGPSSSVIDTVIRCCAELGRQAVMAGAHGVEMHCAHGYLLDQMIAGLDGAGMLAPSTASAGGLAPVQSLLDDVLGALRASLGPDAVIGVRIGDVLDGPSWREVLSQCTTHPDYVSVSVGTPDGYPLPGRGLRLRPYVVPWLDADSSPALRLADELRPLPEGVAVVVSANEHRPEEARNLVHQGRADVIGLTRPLIADPAFVSKLLKQRDDQVRTCFGANECHVTGLQGRSFACAINPEAGRERLEMTPLPSLSGRQVLVVGAGPAGLSLAARLRNRGARVVVVEREERTGGLARLLAGFPSFERWRRSLDWIEWDARDRGVEIDLGVRFQWSTETTILHDVVIDAGGRKRIDAIAGPGTLSSSDALRSPPDANMSVLIDGDLDGRWDPISLAVALTDHGVREVTLSTGLETPGKLIDAGVRRALLRRLAHRGVRLLRETLVGVVEMDRIGVVTTTNGERRWLPRPDVVIRTAAEAHGGEISRRSPSPAAVGDARSPGSIALAIGEAHAMARALTVVPGGELRPRRSRPRGTS